MFKKVNNIKENDQLLNLGTFRLKLAETLSKLGLPANGAKRGRPSGSTIQRELVMKKFRGPAQAIPLKDVRLDQTCHWAVWISWISSRGRDDEFVNGDFNPGKRCVNMWDEGCVNGQLVGSGRDDEFVNGGFNPGKRCVNMWDEGCVNGQLVGSGRDDEFVNGGFNPGKRCVGVSCNAHNLGNDQRRTKINNRLAYFLTKHFKNNHN
ncbi:unnamed protein product, partial [Brenthis ino]